MASKKADKGKKADKKETKPTNLRDVLAQVNTKYGKGTILPAKEARLLEMERVPCGIFNLDLAIGGGIPRGRITTVKGEYSTGKSAVCLKAAASFQHHCRMCCTPIDEYILMQGWKRVGCKCGKNDPMRVVWLDAEHNFDSAWAARFGVNLDEIFVIRTEYAEQGIDVVDHCIRSGECDLLVVDSIAALTPMVEVEQSSESWQMGVAARLMSKACRKWTSALNAGGMLAETQVTMMAINQYRMNISGYGPQKVSPGGKALDFYQSVEIELKKDDVLTDDELDREVGVNVEFHIKKNKTAPPHRTGQYGLYFVDQPKLGYSVGDSDLDVQVLRMAVYWRLIEKNGSWFVIEGDKVQGEPAAAKKLRSHPELFKRMHDRVRNNELHWISTGEENGPKTKGSSAEQAEPEHVGADA